jgi:hypothetical protein
MRLFATAFLGDDDARGIDPTKSLSAWVDMLLIVFFYDATASAPNSSAPIHRTCITKINTKCLKIMGWTAEATKVQKFRIHTDGQQPNKCWISCFYKKKSLDESLAK